MPQECKVFEYVDLAMDEVDEDDKYNMQNMEQAGLSSDHETSHRPGHRGMLRTRTALHLMSPM